MTIRHTIAALVGCFGAAIPALAAPTVAVDSAVFVERHDPAKGRSLERAARLGRGDRVVYIVNWYRMGGDGGFTVTNPMPRGVYYQGSANGDEDISIDGGKSWGKLGTLRIGARLATPEDVTHIRWRIIPAVAAKGSGRIAYSAIVR